MVLALKSEGQKHRECADERDRDGDHRDERGADAAKKQEDDEHDEDERLGKRVDDLVIVSITKTVVS